MTARRQDKRAINGIDGKKHVKEERKKRRVGILFDGLTFNSLLLRDLILDNNWVS